MESHEAISRLEGMSGDKDQLRDCKKIAELIRELRSSIFDLVEAGRAVVDNSDDAGCEDLTVTTKESIETLSGVVYTCRACGKLWNGCLCNSADGGYQSP